MHLKLAKCHFNAKINDADLVAVTISNAFTVHSYYDYAGHKAWASLSIVTHDQFIYIYTDLHSEL